MFGTVLIANRGEIACRIISTCQKLGVRSVAVYSEADADAMHVDLADEAYLIGPAEAAKSYLDTKAILKAAKDSRAEAIHPGYGFLSENADFAEAVEKAGMVFIGPPASAIRAMGVKNEAKSLMDKAGVPLVPGYHGDDQSEKLLRAESRKIGFPQLIKAASGGGGKGMRVVEKEKDFTAALEGAKREAKNAFSDDRVLIEKYITNPRHVEIQVFTDTHGNGVYLFERDCSVQRRHQKVIEEAPAPGLDEATRQKMGAAAVNGAQAIGYVGAGTFEFLLDADGASFYFMEMNTRLQVEHPVTEMITGQDLVEWQLRIAAGDKLPLTQEELTINGHAVEARIYAEDPDRDFLPQTGTIEYLSFGDGRVDTGVRQGDEISVHYDPMIAKIITHGETRDVALSKMRRALAQTHIAGLNTNVAFLHKLAGHADFVGAKLDTGFIPTHEKTLLPSRAVPDGAVYALAGLAVMLDSVTAPHRDPADPYSPWGTLGSWRMNLPARDNLRFIVGGARVDVTVYTLEDGFRVTGDFGDYHVSGHRVDETTLDVVLDGKAMMVTVVELAKALVVFMNGQSYHLGIYDPIADAEGREHGAGRVSAPMPGKIIAVLAKAGAKVSRGDPLVILEAMKMEHTISAPSDGVVAEILFAPGDQVEDGVDLVDFNAA